MIVQWLELVYGGMILPCHMQCKHQMAQCLFQSRNDKKMFVYVLYTYSSAVTPNICP